MIRRLAVLAAALGAMLVGGGAVAVASPAPDAPGDGAVRCNYTMSDPHVVTVSGTQMVTATLTPAACSGTANPKSTQVCIATGNSVGRCMLASGYETAQVYFSPYVPGVNYVAKGSGCAGLSTPAVVLCSSVGPKAASL
jgi:hypothetical protein